MEVGAARKDHQREAEVERGAKSDCRLCIKVGWEGMLLRFPFLFFFFFCLFYMMFAHSLIQPIFICPNPLC